MLMQFFQFAGIGAIGTAAHFLVLAALVGLDWNALLATTLGAVCGATVNYVLSCHFIFRRRSHWIAVPQFASIAMVGWALNAALFQAQHAWLGIDLWLAQCVTTGVVLIWNFAGNRLWTFAEPLHA